MKQRPSLLLDSIGYLITTAWRLIASNVDREKCPLLEMLGLIPNFIMVGGISRRETLVVISSITTSYPVFRGPASRGTL